MVTDKLLSTLYLPRSAARQDIIFEELRFWG